MSFLSKYFKGWSFRTTHPTLAPGTEVNVFLAEYDPDEEAGLALVGDTRLYVSGAESDHVGRRVRVAVKEFRPDDSVGYGEFVRVVGESSYAG
ncbi:hypothetical protein HacjB3_08990 [Halalkalicoccus jeotgali B3]|uniref:DUF7513 domain-containing protein n=1 Tax=Halalkalicoccus jeotgali (strain DSM 18796 / CECT 7217 / JCM 14584 / KCTC 4019 / B3) TaxID=795797 RepID=D8J374_HALJB|nr:hypothetical protein [Halalkalicoccus jeotgali]ADJ15181.1 hypothetical protein HacjB3_08990 [Halalkalicoccus jeotgali B3]